jgi:hypothetical protein
MPVFDFTYSVKYDVSIQADSLDDAQDKLYDADLPEEDGHVYVDDSFEILDEKEGEDYGQIIL